MCEYVPTEIMHGVKNRVEKRLRDSECLPFLILLLYHPPSETELKRGDILTHTEPTPAVGLNALL